MRNLDLIGLRLRGLLERLDDSFLRIRYQTWDVETARQEMVEGNKDYGSVVHYRPRSVPVRSHQLLLILQMLR